MAKRNKDIEYRQDGLIFAFLFLAGHSADQLEEELQKREKTGIKLALQWDELETNEGTYIMRDFIEQAQNLIWCYSLRVLGFSTKRMERNLSIIKQIAPRSIWDAYLKLDDLREKVKHLCKVSILSDTDEDYLNSYKPNRDVCIYNQLREDGIKAGLEIYKREGIVGLKRKVTRTQYLAKYAQTEVEYANVVCRSLVNEVVIMQWLVTLHENEGWSNLRLNRVMDIFEYIYGLINDHTIGYEDIYRQVKDHIPINTDMLTPEPNWSYVGPQVAPQGSEALMQAINYRRDKLFRAIEEERQKAIVEPQNWNGCSYPCMSCPDRAKCKQQDYRNQCITLELYKEIRKTNARQNIA